MDWTVMNTRRISVLELANLVVECVLFFMQTYLTDVCNLSITHAAAIVNIWNGASMILPFFFIFIVDTYLGNFRMLVLSSITYTLGMALIAMSTPPILANSTGTCKYYKSQCIGPTQKVLLYIGMVLSAAGMAGQLVSAKPFLVEQSIEEEHELDVDAVEVEQEQEEVEADVEVVEVEDEAEVEIQVVEETEVKEIQVVEVQEEEEEDVYILGGISIKPFISVVLMPVIGMIILAKIKSWSLLFGIPAICTALATIVFLSGWRTYNKVEPRGSPYTDVCRVFVASASKIFTPFPPHAHQLIYKEHEHQSFSPTRFLRFLEKAAIIFPDEISPDGNVKKKWKLCSVSQVEEAKTAVRMVPMWMTFVVCGIVSSIGNTYFLEQANHMNRKLGSWEVPLPIVVMVILWFTKHVAELVPPEKNPMLEVFTHHDLGIKFSVPMYMFCGILCCITAAIVETKRLRVIRKHGLLENPSDEIPVSVFWLYIQFYLLGGQDLCLKLGVFAFFNKESPESMRNYLPYYSKGVYGLGYMFGVLSVIVVGKVSQIGGRTSWFQFTLNKSHLDRYYWFLAALASLNLVIFHFVAWNYRFKNQDAQDTESVDIDKWLDMKLAKLTDVRCTQEQLELQAAKFNDALAVHRAVHSCK